MRRRALATSASAVAIGLVLFSASPASAAELPATDELHTLTDSDFFSTSSTGASTFISDLPQEGTGKYGADFDVTTGNAYFFADDGLPVCTLYSLNPTTGVSTLVGPVGTDGMDECDALNVDSDGVIRIADQDGVMITVNKATGATISSVTVTGPGAISFIEQSSTGQFYVGDYDGSIYTLNVTTGATVFVAQPTDYIETASFDSADTLWFSGDGDGCQGLNSLSLADPAGTLTAQGSFTDADGCLDVYAMFIAQSVADPDPVVPDVPELADTGATALDAMLPFALLVLVAGAGALALSRRTSTT
ncbi:MAG: hypothetical protein Q7J04_03650 [Microcella sp.]|nr:hypothetical protein [Microcella sp.]